MSKALKSSVAARTNRPLPTIPGKGLAVVLLSAVLAALAGCGQKGPLVLPPSGAASAPAPAAR